MFKKILTVLIGICMFVMLTGIYSFAADNVINVRLAINQDPGTPQYRSSMLFAEKVKELSNGTIAVTVYPSMQLGGYREQPEMVQTGTIEMTKTTGTVASNFAKDFEAFDIPFLFNNTRAMRAVLNGPVGKEIAESLRDQGFVPLGYSTGGLKQMTANRPIHNPDDFKGLKFRIMASTILTETYKSLGANPVPIDFAELYNALQQGVVDGQENPLQTVDMMKLWEVQDHMTLSNIGPMIYVVVANQNWFENLSQELQQNIIDAFDYALATEWGDNDSQEEAWLENAINNGMEVYYPTDSDMQAFRDKTKGVVNLIRDRVGSDLVDRLMEAAKEANEEYQ